MPAQMGGFNLQDKVLPQDPGPTEAGQRASRPLGANSEECKNFYEFDGTLPTQYESHRIFRDPVLESVTFVEGVIVIFPPP